MPLVGFFGCPASGKTTVAAKLFAGYKENHYSSELITESARTYIALLRSKKGCDIEFTDEDHLNILNDQLKLESYYILNSKPSSILITDGSILNSCLYMKNPDWDEVVRKSLGHYDRIFVCDPVPPPPSDDLRLHSYEESLAIHEKVLEIEEKHLDDLPFIHLSGNLLYRTQTARTAILEAQQEQEHVN